MEQDKEREEFQTARQHIEHHGVFCDVAVGAVVLGRADQGQAGADVVDGGGDGGDEDENT